MRIGAVGTGVQLGVLKLIAWLLLPRAAAPGAYRVIWKTPSLLYRVCTVRVRPGSVRWPLSTGAGLT